MFEEIRTVLPNQESDVTLDDLKNMPYVDALIKESLRFLPVAPLLTRVVREEMQLGSSADWGVQLYSLLKLSLILLAEDLTIPKGTEYLMDIMNLHRKQENWKFDATQFNPANFFPENALPRSQYSYIPFGAGPRQCIGETNEEIFLCRLIFQFLTVLDLVCISGMRYGNIVLKLFVVYLVRKYRFTTTLKLEDLQFEMNITLHMMNKNVFQIHKRSAYWLSIECVMCVSNCFGKNINKYELHSRHAVTKKCYACIFLLIQWTSIFSVFNQTQSARDVIS